MNKIIFLLVIIIGIIIFYLIIKKPTVRQNSKSVSKFRVYDNLISLQEVKSIQFPNSVYRLSCSGDSLIILTSNQKYFIANKQLAYYRQIDLAQPLYGLTKIKDTFFGIDVTHQTYTLKSNAFFSSGPLPNIIGQGYYQDGQFFYIGVKQSFGLDNTDSIFIYKIAAGEKFPSVIAQLNLMLKQILGSQHSCMIGLTEGSFFKISEQSWGYLFYYGSYFFSFEKDSVNIHSTVGKEGFKNFKEKTVELDGAMATACQPENPAFLNFQAATDSQNIYVLPSIVQISRNGSNALIDVYSKQNYQYKHSIKVYLNSQNDYPNQMMVIGEYFFLYYKSGMLKSFILRKNK